MFLKSCAFLVTRHNSFCNTVAAINESMDDIFFPFFKTCHHFPPSEKSLYIKVQNSFIKYNNQVFVQPIINTCFFEKSFSLQTPFSISPIVINYRNNFSSSIESIQSITCLVGFCLTNSDIIYESNKYFIILFPWNNLYFFHSQNKHL